MVVMSRNGNWPVISRSGSFGVRRVDETDGNIRRDNGIGLAIDKCHVALRMSPLALRAPPKEGKPQAFGPARTQPKLL